MGMDLQMRKDLGLCRGVARRDKSCGMLVTEVKPGRWQVTHNSLFGCCGFILVFFATVTTICYFFKPSILSGMEEQPFSKWYPDELKSIVDQEASTDQIRRILTGRPQTTTALQLQRDVVDDKTRGAEAKYVWRQEQRDALQNALNQAGYENPLNLATDLRIYVYDLPPSFNVDWLNDSRCSNHLFAAEVALHQILLESPLRTMDPDSADFFFVPVYVACNFSPKNGFPSLAKATKMIRSAVDLISRQMMYWNRNGGSDHIFVATHDYGACFNAVEELAIVSGIPKFLRNSIIVQTFGQTGGHPCHPVNSILIPPYVSPKFLKQYWQPVESQNRDIFAHFRGKLELHPKMVKGQLYSKGIRTRLWRKFKKNDHFFLERKRLEGYQTEMLRSKFCLAPLGWAPWSPRIVEAVVYGCVPVIIADDIALPHSHIIDWPGISLTVREKDIDKLDKILRHVAATNLTTIQENLWNEKNRRALLFSRPMRRGDASWHVFDLLARRKVFNQAQKALDQHRSIFGNVQENQIRGESLNFASV